jgi:hypothetical protein
MTLMIRTLTFAVLSLLAAAARCEDGTGGSATAGTGLKAYVDPTTGESLNSPREPMPSLQVPHDDSARGLREIASPDPDGGVSVDLEGRFQSPLEATVRPDGTPSIRHVPATPRP